MNDGEVLNDMNEVPEEEPQWSNQNICRFLSYFERRPMMTKWVCPIEEQETMKFSIWEKLQDTFDIKAVKFFSFTEKDEVYVYPLIETYEGERCLITEAEDKYYMYRVFCSQDLHALSVIALQNRSMMSNIWYVISFFASYVSLLLTEDGNIRRLCMILLSGMICQLIQYYMTYKYFCVRQQCCSESIPHVRTFLREYVWAMETRNRFWMIFFLVMFFINTSVSFLFLQSGVLQRFAAFAIAFFLSFSFAFDLVIEDENEPEDEKGKQERQNRNFVYFFASSCFLLVWIIVINFVIPDAFYRLLFRSFIDVMPAFIQKLSQIYFFEILFFIIKAVFYFALPPAAAGKVAQLAYLFVRRRRKRLFQQNENHANDLH